MNRFVCLLGLVLLAACATGPATVSPVVTRFSQPLFTTPLEKTFSILPYPEQRGSLQFETYAHTLQTELEYLGWRPVTKNAHYVVMFTYEVGAPYTRTETYTDYRPIRTWEHCGFTLSHLCPDTDYVRVPRTDIDTVWPLRVRAVILDGPSFRKGQHQTVWEGESRLDSSSPDLAPFMTPLIRSLFVNFPGPSGIPQRYTLPLPSYGTAD